MIGSSIVSTETCDTGSKQLANAGGGGAGRTPEGKRSLLLGPPAALIIMNRYYSVPGLAEAIASLSRD